MIELQLKRSFVFGIGTVLIFARLPMGPNAIN
jgi:hypothetical protein